MSDGVMKGYYWKTKSEESTRLPYTGLLGELEPLKTNTRLIDEMFVSVMGEYVWLQGILLWINKAKAKDKMYMSVGVMKDYKQKLWKLQAPYTDLFFWSRPIFFLNFFF